MMVDSDGRALDCSTPFADLPIHPAGSVSFFAAVPQGLIRWNEPECQSAISHQERETTVNQCFVGRTCASVVLLAAAFVAVPHGFAQPGGPQPPKHYPWSDSTLSADARADMVIKELTLEEKISLLHGQGFSFNATGPTESNGGAGYSVAIPRVGIPAIQMADSAYGVTRGAASGRYSTALPNNLAAASSWDPQAAFEYGALIGRELRQEGYSMSLGGGVNLPREPRNGRTFEYQGEDPLLAGTLVGNFVKGVQSQHVIGDLKHYAINDQESGRNAVNANIDKRSMRETDLRAFEIALKISDAGAFMCSYNRVNGDYACENSYLLTDILRKTFHFQGFVLSDWGGTHSTAKASHAGLDQEQPGKNFFGDALKKAVEDGEVSQDEINEHVHRILRTIFATGLFDNPIVKQVPDVEGGYTVAQKLAEKSIVLLKNEHDVLPLDAASLHSVVLIGGHADVGVLTGGGSAQVDAPGRVRSSSSPRSAWSGSHGKSSQTSSVVTEFAIARPDSQTAFHKDHLCLQAMTWQLPLLPPRLLMSQSSSAISRNRKAWT